AIKVNGKQLWPKAGPNYLTPDSWATHETFTHVRRGDAVTFELSQRTNSVSNRTSWNPTISYEQPVTFTTDESIRVMNRDDCKKIGIDYFDMQLRPIPGSKNFSGALRWLH